MAVHEVVRIAALVVACASLVVLVSRTHIRFDLTAERLSSLAPETRTLLAALPVDRDVQIQAFVTPDVPEQLVQTRENLIGVLREIAARAGARVSVTYRGHRAVLRTRARRA